MPLWLVLRDRVVHRLEARTQTDRNALRPDHRPNHDAQRNLRLEACIEADNADESPNATEASDLSSVAPAVSTTISTPLPCAASFTATSQSGVVR
jgi:hypothetical protein